MKMGPLGDFAKGFVTMTVVFWIFLIIEFVFLKQIVLALLFLFTLTIPLSMIAFEYLRDWKKEVRNIVGCHVCGRQVEEYEHFVCSDCGEITCNSCGDGDLCNLCIGDEVFIADILDSEEEF